MTSSGSAPIYFDPQSYTDGYNFNETLIDGGIICNNPAMYAYLHAENYLNKGYIRVLSLGTGLPPVDEEDNKDNSDEDSTSKLSTLQAFASFDYVMNYESETSNAILNTFLNSKNKPD